MIPDPVVVLAAAIVCMLATIACTLLVSLSLKLYTEIMKEKVISSRVKLEHSCAHTQKPIGQVDVPFMTGIPQKLNINPPPPLDIKPSSPPSPPPIKRIPLRDAIIMARKLMKHRGR